jgi:hypothetical protein
LHVDDDAHVFWLGGDGAHHYLIYNNARHGTYVDIERWVSLSSRIQKVCQKAARVVLVEFDDRFPPNRLLRALSIVHPVFWRRGNDATRARGLTDALNAIKDFYCKPGYLHSGIKVPPLLNYGALRSQFDQFKIQIPIILGHSATLPSTTELWRRVAERTMVAERMTEFIKLAELSIAIPIGSVESERRFSSMNYIKDQVRNRLGEMHLSVAVRIFTQQMYNVQNFPYDRAYKLWLDSPHLTRGRYLLEG